MPTTFTAMRIADYFILKSQQEGKSITNKKLQKLLYYAQAWSLALNNKKLFDDPIEAWVHGPAVRSVYLAYKQFGSEPIKKDVSPESVNMPAEEAELLGNVWRVYGKFDANYLELLSHNEVPWQEARADLTDGEASQNIISTETMKSFYDQKLEEAQRTAS